MRYMNSGELMFTRRCLQWSWPTWRERGEYSFERRKFGATPEQLKQVAAWLMEQEVQEAVMESTAQYWRPVWKTLERYWQPACRSREEAGPEGGKSASGASAIQSWAARPQERFSGCRATGEATDGARTGAELRASGGHKRERNGDLILDKADMRLRLWSVVGRRSRISKQQLHARAGAPYTKPFWSRCWNRRISSCPAMVSDLLGVSGTADAGSSGRRGDGPGRRWQLWLMAGCAPRRSNYGTHWVPVGKLHASLPAAAEDGAGRTALDRSARWRDMEIKRVTERAVP